MHLTNDVGRKTKVIGRAYAGEPICLFVLRDNGASALVVGENESKPRPIGYKKEWLYRFEPGLFRRLREAWERHDAEELTQLWAETPPLF